MKLPVAEARALAEDVLKRAGLPEESARIVSDVLIEAELRGRQGHGLIRLSALAQHARKCHERAVVLSEGGHWVRLDGRGEIGYLTAHRAMALAIAKAQAQGTGLAAVCNATHCGMLSYYVLMAAEKGLIGVMTCNCSPRVAPFGGATAVFGTNPIAIAIPALDEPIVVDMATSAATTGDLLVALQKGETLEEGLAYDADGRSTRDAKKALDGALAAFGGHKGSALALVSQILSGALVGAAALPEPGKDYGFLIAVLDPRLFTPIEAFRKGVGEVLTAMKNAKPIGDGPVLVPGERSHRARREALKGGIDVDNQLFAEIKNLLK